MNLKLLIRRAFFCALMTTICTAAVPSAHAEKVLRYAIRAAETGFDPVQITDLYSRYITGNIFDAPLRYKWLGHGEIEPNTLESMPEMSADFKTFTFHLKHGIYFAADPAFKGQMRELTAEDYVFSFKRIYDPRWNSQQYGGVQQYNIESLESLRAAAVKSGHFDYDTPIDGIRALDRYTWQIKVGVPSPRFPGDIYVDASTFGAVAREVVEAYGDKIMEHPVGTGAYMLLLSDWVRSSKMVLVRNPNYRSDIYHSDPGPSDPEGQALAATLQGRAMPFVDRVELSVIEESQPRWLSFLNGEEDYLDAVPPDLVSIAYPNNKLAPNLTKKNLVAQRLVTPRYYIMTFNMNDPLVGGYTADKVALRRAIGLGLDVPVIISNIWKYEAVPAQGVILPGQTGYNSNLHSEMGDYDPARANAILDAYGYLPKHGGKWRDLPDGTPFSITYSTTADQLYRSIDEVVKKSFDALGIRMTFKPAQFPEQLKAAEAGTYSIWFLGFSSTQVNPVDMLQGFYGPASGGSNLSFFNLKEYDELYRQQDQMPDGPQRMALIDKMRDIINAYMPTKFALIPIQIYLWYPWLKGMRFDPLVNDWWRYVDIDDAQQKPHLQ